MPSAFLSSVLKGQRIVYKKLNLCYIIFCLFPCHFFLLLSTFSSQLKSFLNYLRWVKNSSISCLNSIFYPFFCLDGNRIVAHRFNLMCPFQSHQLTMWYVHYNLASSLFFLSFDNYTTLFNCWFHWFISCYEMKWKMKEQEDLQEKFFCYHCYSIISSLILTFIYLFICLSIYFSNF